MAMKTLWRSSTFTDRVIVSILLLITILSFYLQFEGELGAYVVVESPGGKFSRSPLSVDATLAPVGKIGETIIQIRDNAVHVVASDCPLKVCISQGSINQVDELIACVPNGILIYVEGNENYDDSHLKTGKIDDDRGYDQISR